MENETVPVPELYTATPGDMGGAPVPELINEMPVDGMPVPEMYTNDMMDAELYMGVDGMPMDDYYGTTPVNGVGVAMFAGMMMLWMVFMFAFLVLMIISVWKIFTKAGEDGWKSLIPFYNTWVLLEVSGKPGWWLFLMFIPFVNIVIMIMMYNGLSKAFGKGVGYLIGLIFLPIIFFPMLAFGKSEYIKSAESSGNDNIPPQNPVQEQQNTQQNQSQNPTV